MNITETYLEFANRKAAAAKAEALAARIRIGAVPANQITSYEFIQDLIAADARYAEWAVVAMMVETRAGLGTPDAVLAVEIAGYVQDRILGFQIASSSGKVSNLLDDQRL